MIISIAAAKAFDKMKYPKKLGIAGSCLHMIEDAHNKLQPTLCQMVALLFKEASLSADRGNYRDLELAKMQRLSGHGEAYTQLAHLQLRVQHKARSRENVRARGPG